MFTARTPKERWALSIWNLKNQIRAEKGEETITDETELAYFVRTNSGRNKQLHELRYQYEQRKDELERLRKENAAKAYWSTEDGSKRKEALEKEREAIRNEFRAFSEECQRKADEIVAASLGNGWKVFQLSERYMKIAMVNPENPDDSIFGSEIEVYYEMKSFEGIDRENGKVIYKERFEINVWTMGSFDALSEDCTSRAAFYIGLGHILADKASLEAIREVLRSLSNSIVNKWEKIDKIDRQLKNPFETESK